MINVVVWCAMMMGDVPVHAEGIVLSESISYLTVRFSHDIIAVRKTECLFEKPKEGSLVPFVRKK